MPGMYQNGEYDLAGFAVGAVERTSVIPRKDDIIPGNVLIGLASSGIHSNGFSMVRKILEISGMTYTDTCPFGDGDRTFSEELLTPTKIYVKSVLPLIKQGKIKACAHITGWSVHFSLFHFFFFSFNILIFIPKRPTYLLT